MLFQKIDNKLSSSDAIQTILMIGEGGSGKTTLAYHYANQYNKGLVWSINANTRENILVSFEKLVIATCDCHNASAKRF
jgi:hypothetical protein